MLVLQQIKVLPKGADIVIYDGTYRGLMIRKSDIDGSLIFRSAEEANYYDKVFSTFKVHELHVEAHDIPILSDDNNEYKQVIKYCIQIRGKSDEN